MASQPPNSTTDDSAPPDASPNQPSESAPNSAIPLWVAVIGLIATIAAAIITGLFSIQNKKIEIQASQTAEALRIIQQTDSTPAAAIATAIPTVTPTTWACWYQPGPDEAIFEEIIAEEAQAVMAEDLAAIRKIYSPGASVQDARYASQNAFTQYERKFREESHRDIHHKILSSEISGQNAVVMTHATGEWYDAAVQTWKPYGVSPNNADLNRWTFTQTGGCWQISSLTYNLLLATPTPAQ